MIGGAQKCGGGACRTKTVGEPVLPLVPARKHSIVYLRVCDCVCACVVVAHGIIVVVVVAVVARKVGFAKCDGISHEVQ